VLVKLPHYDKILEINILKGGRIYFDSQFQRFQSIVTWLHYFGPLVRQNIMAGS
jgi:hypothetical protein